MHYYNFISLWTRHHYLELIYRQEFSEQEYPDGYFLSRVGDEAFLGLEYRKGGWREMREVEGR